MPSYTMLNVKMQRESNSTPWGFRMQGGKDFGCPLQIQKVNPGSLAERCGMQANDYIVKIGQTSTEHLKHPDAQELIKQQNDMLELTLQRGAPPDANDYNDQVEFPPHQLMEPTGNISSSQPQYRPAPQPPVPQVAMPISNNRAILSQGHNTPIGLYSAENVTDTISRTLKETDERPSSTTNRTDSQVDPATIKGFRYTPNPMNISPEYKVEEPKNYNEFKATAARSMPKPAPSNYSQPQQQPPRPAPFVAPPPPAPAPVQPKPSAAGKPSFNVNAQAAPRSGNRVFMKGNKGSASVNRTDNINQTAICYACGTTIRGPYVSAIGRCYCVDHFTCSKCSANLVESGFVEENGKLYCERDFEQFLAPHCAKCSQAILKECVHALQKTWHPECFTCTACKKSIGTGSFHVEEGEPYCLEDYRRMFQAKCTSCEFPIEPGDKYLEAMGGTYHVECFNCSMCQVSLDGQPFVVKNDRPYCRLHGR